MYSNPMNRYALLLAVVATMVVSAALRPVHAAAIFEGLGMLQPVSGDPTGSWAWSVSGNGEVVVGRDYGQQSLTGQSAGAAYWTAATGWVGLSVNETNLGSESFAVSDDGTKAVGYCVWEEAGNWGISSTSWVIGGDNTGFCGLRFVDPEFYSSGVLESAATDVSSDGSSSVGWSDEFLDTYIYDGQTHFYTTAFWNAGRLNNPSFPYTGESSYANAISGDGSTVLGWDSKLGPFRWTSGGAMSLGNAADGNTPSAIELSWDGSVIVGVAGGYAYQWSATIGWEVLDQLPGTVTASVTSVSGDGALILGHSDDTIITLWNNGVPVNLMEELTTVDGIDLTGWSQLQATAISQDGTVIVGTGVNVDGLNEAWRVRLAPSPDVDGDTISPPMDCNDNNASVFPGATEIPYDGIDQDCSGSDLTDVDQDSFSVPLDCNDNDATIYPGATEIPDDGIDQDCDGSDLTDVDQDSFSVPLDCNDNNASIYPGAPETKHDGIDQDCNGYDLTIDIVKAEVKGKRSYTLSVIATSALGADAALVLEGYGPLDYNARKNRWTATLRKLATPPATVTVTGTEGSETVATTGP